MFTLTRQLIARVLPPEEASRMHNSVSERKILTTVRIQQVHLDPVIHVILQPTQFVSINNDTRQVLQDEYARVIFFFARNYFQKTESLYFRITVTQAARLWMHGRKCQVRHNFTNVKKNGFRNG